jgi:hypothetical protein
VFSPKVDNIKQVFSIHNISHHQHTTSYPVHHKPQIHMSEKQGNLEPLEKLSKIAVFFKKSGTHQSPTAESLGSAGRPIRQRMLQWLC